MIAVCGTHPVASSLISELKLTAPTIHICGEPQETATLWRRGNLETGEGLREALEGVEYLFVLMAKPCHLHGLSLVLKNQMPRIQGTLIRPAGVSQPVGLHSFTSLNQLEIGVCWGPGMPLYDQWAVSVENNQTIWLPRRCPMSVIDTTTVVQASLALKTRKEERWQLTGDICSPFQLATALAQDRGRQLSTRILPLPWVRRRWGVSREQLKAWQSIPSLPRHTSDWEDAN